MIFNITFLLIGLSLLLYSADKVVDYSDRIAKFHNISPVIIGLTLVAFGTSAPELVITIVASFNNPPNTDAIIGNVIGSNIANIFLILGLAGFFFNIDLKQISISDNNFFLIISVYFFSIFLLSPSINPYISAGFIILFYFYFRHLFISAKQEEIKKNNEKLKNYTYILLVIYFIFLFLGGKLFLDNSLKLFALINMPELIIGVLVLAIGTSLPELATIISSYRRKVEGIGIGNIIGSNIMNILIVFLPGVIITQLRNYEFHLSHVSINVLIVFLVSSITIIMLRIFDQQINRLIASIFLILYFLCAAWAII
tara:strand:+ start:717 stop:1652 length:936 start_codon:yes stop_codon:yes gene_type:complete